MGNKMGLKTTLATSLLLSGQAMAALPPIIQKGTKFFYENGTQFFMKGIAYQEEFGPGGSTTSSKVKYIDPLADVKSCKRDVPLLAELRTNTIRTYAIDPEADHDECMEMLDKAGIYVIADLSEPNLSINREDPLWDVDLFDRYKKVIDSLAKYSNVIGFFAGNEVSNDATNTEASAFVKAAVRDTKKHIRDNHERWMGVGYAANDDDQIRVNIAHYFNCGDQDDAIDYWGYNIYSWCGKSSISASGFDKQADFFRNYSVPVFFAEYGCNKVGNTESSDIRTWEDTLALYSDEMTDVFSGGIVYMYHEEDNTYGLVDIREGGAKKLKNFSALKTQIAKVDPSSTAMEDYSPTNSPQACPDVAEKWQVNAAAMPPTPDSDLCECMYDSLTCVPDDSTAKKAYGDMFNYVCEEDANACAGIKADVAAGVYGPYGMCNAKQKLGYVLDQFYKNQNSQAFACDFEGQAKILSSPKGPAASCSPKLQSASKAVEKAATATVADPADNEPAVTPSSSSFASPMRAGQMPAVFDYAIGAYAVVAMAVGGAMVML